MDKLTYPEDCIKVLDKGFVRLVDHMGDDSSICEMARVSYKKGTKKTSKEDRTLIRYLMRHHHTSPTEGVEFKFHLRLPCFVRDQLVRHRTFSFNFESLRYSEAKDFYYVPAADKVTGQSTSNKQGGSEEVIPYPKNYDDRYECWEHALDSEQSEMYHLYQQKVKLGVRRELARINLPFSQYVECYAKVDLHNLFHFLRLRLDSHAQYEIRVYAEAIAELIKPIVPLSWEAFEDYRLNALTLTGPEVNALRSWFSEYEGLIIEDSREDLTELTDIVSQLENKREQEEFKKKIERIFRVEKE